MASQGRQDARYGPDLPPADLVYIWLNRGRDNAEPIGSIAERLKLTRRQVEQAVQVLRLSGLPVASGPEGVWIGDRKDIADTVESMRRRRLHQAMTERALRRWLRQTGEVQQQTLFGEAA